MIADSTQVALLTLWEKDVNTLSWADLPFQPSCCEIIQRQTSASTIHQVVQVWKKSTKFMMSPMELDHDNLIEGAKVMGISELGRIYI